VLGSVPVLLGLIARGVLPPTESVEQVLPLLSRHVLGEVGFVIFAGTLVSAILSTVDSALLAAGALTAHNVVVPLFPGLGERGKLLVNRSATVLYGVIACGLALSAEGVYELVETASSLGTSGILWLLLFSLYSKRFGGPIAATAALISGVAAFVVSSAVLDLETPFLISCAVSLGLYAAIALFEKRSGADDRSMA
jgi:SSS family solute:Na+ symporter